MSGERLLLLDSASLYFRAFYGVPDQRESPTEHPTNAVRGFIDMLATLINAHHPTELVACWDNDWRPQWRVDLIPSYKAHRVAGVSDAVPAGEEPDQGHPATGGLAEEVPDDLGPQVPLIVDALTAFGIARIGVDGYEADDVIGSLVARHKGRLPIDVVSGDRDMLQLVELVEASPSRFVKLDDGRFLALTAQLRQRIEELAAYGDRRPNQNKLRFPRVRAAALEDLAE